MFVRKYTVTNEFTTAMSHKFCSNISFMFTEVPFLERYKHAKNAGFRAVESGFPFGLKLQEVIDAKKSANIDQILINTYTGDVSKRELGFAALPGEEKSFRESITLTLLYAKALNAKKVHIMSGVVEHPTEKNLKCYVENLKYASKLLEAENLLGVIEPINKYSVPGYFMNCYKKALEVVKSVDSPHLKIMVDIFHMQHIQGNIFYSIKELSEHIGHIQVAQYPYRNEPDTVGEINYQFVFDTLKSNGYSDWIGLEYKPQSNTADGLKWIKQFGFVL